MISWTHFKRKSSNVIYSSKNEDNVYHLFISKSIVEAHGGKIWAENNKEGKGATFSFSLHLADNDDKSYADENLSKTIEEK